jgi:hypothetical protein
MFEYKKKAIRSADWNYGGGKWKLSRSKIDLFMECPRCFYIDNKLGVARPKGPSFTLNIAVDALLKKEFDIHRDGKTSHPLMKAYGVAAIPFQHKSMSAWRDNFEGIQFRHPETKMLICGAVDDIWINPQSELMVVDYKATSKDGKMDSLDDTKWQTQYRRQMEVYQWLLKQNGFKVSSTGYFVYVNGKKDRAAFDGKLEFDVTLIAHVGNDNWIDQTLVKIKECLEDKRIPGYTDGCDYCNYIKSMGMVLRQNAAPISEKPEPKKKTATKKSKKQSEELDIQSLFDVAR